MRALAEAWPEEPIVQQLIAQLPWEHNVRVLDRIKDRPTREWFLNTHPYIGTFLTQGMKPTGVLP